MNIIDREVYKTIYKHKDYIVETLLKDEEITLPVEYWDECKKLLIYLRSTDMIEAYSISKSSKSSNLKIRINDSIYKMSLSNTAIMAC